jgi:hypothetical protein
MPRCRRCSQRYRNGRPLKLEPQKVTVETVVIDHVERVPSEN